MSNKTLGALIHADRKLSELAGQAQQLMRLDAAWRRLLPDALAEASQAVCINGDALVVFAANSAVASRLRFMEATLLPRLAEAGYPARVLRIRVAAPLAPRQRENRLKIGETGLAALSAAAETLPDDGLRRALAELVRHQKARES
ncbi:DUF721 domain-containing protein [Crenobacter cavernae]|uniref:DUF721 domain-containing protein n=1 Tax=Crenobacter cavernae TaxID=2290923 RepID=A0ABY0FE44_9NEIS|nr:DUF721 domain-containing protein [Crenobacter cavernae]RXZ44508.1 DUF721 domain-containing protein [Crenobacter cavernae]